MQVFESEGFIFRDFFVITRECFSRTWIWDKTISHKLHFEFLTISLGSKQRFGYFSCRTVFGDDVMKGLSRLPGQYPQSFHG